MSREGKARMTEAPPHEVVTVVLVVVVVLCTSRLSLLEDVVVIPYGLIN